MPPTLIRPPTDTVALESPTRDSSTVAVPSLDSELQRRLTEIGAQNIGA